MERKTVLAPQRSLGNQVRRCHRMFDRLLSACLAQHGLNSGYWYYLRALWIEDGLTQKQLSDITNVTETTTVTMINIMIRDGLVARARDATDRRKFRVSLTPKGSALRNELMRYAFEINAMASEGIPKAEIETCLSVLARLSDNLQRGFAAHAAHAGKASFLPQRAQAKKGKPQPKAKSLATAST